MFGLRVALSLGLAVAGPSAERVARPAGGTAVDQWRPNHQALMAMRLATVGNATTIAVPPPRSPTANATAR